MNLMHRIQSYGDTHHPKWLDILRIILGIVLISKGVYYIGNTNELNTIINSNTDTLYNMIIIHYVAFAQLFGGVLITVGLLTRIAVLFQLPVLLGAVIFVNAQAGLLSADSELLLSVIVLCLLIFFLIYGSGPWSIDALLDKNKNEWDTDNNL
jgi:putative oxidoreductase